MWTGACESLCKAGASLPKSTGRSCGSVELVWVMSDICIGEAPSPHSLPRSAVGLLNRGGYMWTGACESLCKAGASLPKLTGCLCGSVELVWDPPMLQFQWLAGCWWYSSSLQHSETR